MGASLPVMFTQLKKLAEEREEAAELRSMAKRDAAKEYAVKLDANERKLKEVRCGDASLVCWVGSSSPP